MSALSGSEPPSAEVERIEGDAKEICGDEAELGGADSNDADDGAIDRGDDPALPEFAAKKDRPDYGEHARDVIQGNVVE